MSGFIRNATTGWVGFLVTAAVYMAIQGLTEFAAWLTALGRDGFAGVTLFDWLLFAAKTGASILIVLRALMNGSYGEAKQQPKDKE